MLVHSSSIPSDAGKKTTQNKIHPKKNSTLLQANHRANRKHPILYASELWNSTPGSPFERGSGKDTKATGVPKGPR